MIIRFKISAKKTIIKNAYIIKVNINQVSMKGKKQIEGLITEFLKTSPRARAISRNAILPP
jgi:hypothetical protein